MWRVRLIFLAVIVVLPVTEYFLYGYLANAKEGSRLLLYFFLNTIAAITLVPSAILLLLSTLFKIQVANDETLRYDPKNLFWALMRKLWGDTWGDPISLCKAFWLTALSILMIIVVIFVIAGHRQEMTTAPPYRRRQHRPMSVNPAMAQNRPS